MKNFFIKLVGWCLITAIFVGAACFCGWVKPMIENPHMMKVIIVGVVLLMTFLICVVGGVMAALTSNDCYPVESQYHNFR